ncbi:hypothetical protein G3N18_01980 [Microbacterium sp. 2C]|uniref:hypothetical protein n=1 Tax=Microbacterium paulum TaxID=2707006 RepID=UPI0018C2D330|nr:hypothetical protein [Microbacterium paulum]MBG0716856.1 hypothetical protein [Microbacterium paulum]
MKTTKTTATITLLVAAAIAMAACTPNEDPNAWQTATPSPTSSPTPTANPTTPPTPTAGEQATSESEAVDQATQAVQRYYDATFTMMSTAGLGADYLTGLIVPGAPIEQLVQLNAKSGYRLEGAPTKWSTNAAMSTVGPIKDGTGASAQYGNVDVYGCSSNADTETFDPQGTHLDTPKGSSPGVFSVYFSPSQGAWLIYNFKTLVNRDGTVVEGAPQC